MTNRLKFTGILVAAVLVAGQGLGADPNSTAQMPPRERDGGAPAAQLPPLPNGPTPSDIAAIPQLPPPPPRRPRDLQAAHDESVDAAIGLIVLPAASTDGMRLLSAGEDPGWSALLEEECTSPTLGGFSKCTVYDCDGEGVCIWYGEYCMYGSNVGACP